MNEPTNEVITSFQPTRQRERTNERSNHFVPVPFLHTATPNEVITSFPISLEFPFRSPGVGGVVGFTSSIPTLWKHNKHNKLINTRSHNLCFFSSFSYQRGAVSSSSSQEFLQPSHPNSPTSILPATPAFLPTSAASRRPLFYPLLYSFQPKHHPLCFHHE